MRLFTLYVAAALALSACERVTITTTTVINPDGTRTTTTTRTPGHASAGATAATAAQTGAQQGSQTAAAVAPAVAAATADQTGAQTEAAAAPTAPAGTVLTREGVQTVTLELRNGTETQIVRLSAVVDGRPGPNLLPTGMAIPPGGSFALPVAVGTYLLQATFQPPGAFQPGRAIQRNVIVPRFPPNPPPRMQVTLR
jgi:hypothetical protein